VTISGSTPTAENGLLTLFGGGNKERFDSAELTFRVIAKKYFYPGPNGSGATMKIVVNTLLGIGMQAIARLSHWVRRPVLIVIACWTCCPRPR